MILTLNHINHKGEAMKKWFIFLIIFFFTLPAFVFAQTVDTSWVRRYDGGLTDVDYARGIKVDGSGNVYVTGYSAGSGTGFDYATIKYDPNGNQIWVDRYNGPGNNHDYACAIALDGSGNICVTGTAFGTNPDYTTIKYNPSGTRLWTMPLNWGWVDMACDVTADAAGNVYVTGYVSPNPSVPLDYYTVKYNSDGSVGWSRNFNGPANGDDSASAITIDASGNVYVTGQCKTLSTPYTIRGIGTVKYDVAGNFIWARYISPPPFTVNNHAFDIVVDASSNVYITGRGYGTGGFDYYTAKYATDGTGLWVKTYNGSGNSFDEARAIVVDVSGNVYVTGYSIGSGTQRDFATVKYAPDGTQLWVQRYNGPVNNHDEAYAIALDNSGNIYVTGYSYESGVGGDVDYLTIKYAPDGTQQWEKRYKGPVLADAAHAIAVDNCNNVYVTGESQSLNYDYLTIKYRQNSYSPSVIANDSSEFFCGSDTIRFTVTATDLDACDSITLSGPGIPTPLKGMSPLSADVKIYIDSAGTYDYVYTVTDGMAQDDDTATWVITMNTLPSAFSLVAPVDSSLFVPFLAAFDWADAADPDTGTLLKYTFYASTSPNFHPDSTAIHSNLTVSQYNDTLGIGRYWWKVGVYDGCDTVWSTQTYWTLLSAKRGDANGDKELTVSDVVYLINYLFKGGPKPVPELVVGDANCDGSESVSDVIYLINYLFKGGPAPGC